MERQSSDSGRKVKKSMSRTTTKRITVAASLVVFTLGAAFAQQPTTVATRIDTVPSGLNVQVVVDGQIYITPVTLPWPTGSKHTICVYDQFDPASLIKWSLGAASGSCL